MSNPYNIDNEGIGGGPFLSMTITDTANEGFTQTDIDNSTSACVISGDNEVGKGSAGGKLFGNRVKRRRQQKGLWNGGPELVNCWTAWAEDRATVGIDPSADPGAKTEGRATLGTLGSPVFPCSSGLA